jgi:Rrf2 family nitric oxide-sensitive transcriptional repressor
MLTQTSVTGVRLLIHLGRMSPGKLASIKQVADDLGESQTYLVKIARHLVKSGILRAHRGQTGGVVLNRAPESVTLLDVVEACQGIIHGTFCQETAHLSRTCALHQAGAELHQAMISTLSKWTLADLMAKDCPSRELQSQAACLLQGGRPGLMVHAQRKLRKRPR